MTVFLFFTSYVAMASAGLLVEALFQLLGLVPGHRVAIIEDPQITLNYTSVLNLLFLSLAALLLWRAWRTSGLRILAAMNAAHPEEGPTSTRAQCIPR